MSVFVVEVCMLLIRSKVHGEARIACTTCRTPVMKILQGTTRVNSRKQKTTKGSESKALQALKYSEGLIVMLF